MKPTTAVILAIAVIGALFLFRGRPPQAAAPAEASNVSIVDGTQIVEIDVKGGYLPLTSAVKAGMPTVLRFKTNGTFDCSSSVRIPSLGVSKDLPPTGTTDIALGTLQPGKLQGTCGMGMYRFSLEAKS